MYCDCHIHLLPNMDNGPTSEAEARAMIRMLKDNGCKRAVITPHFDNTRETITSFLARRKAAYHALAEFPEPISGIRFALSAETYITPGIARLAQLERLLLPHTRILPIELPLGRLDDYVIRELSYMIHKRKIQPMICQTERYFIMMPPRDYEKLVSLPNACYEFTASALLDRTIVTEIVRLVTAEKRVLLGSNAHNAQDRRPMSTDLEAQINAHAATAFRVLSRQTGEYLTTVFP